MATITITYTAPTVFEAKATQQIFGVWAPATTASDNAAFNGTYYDTNKWDNGEFPYAETLDAFLAKQVAHPGLIAALRAAVRAYVPATPAQGDTPAVPAKPGTYNWVATDADLLYIEELEPALKDQGFEFTPSSGS